MARLRRSSLLWLMLIVILAFVPGSAAQTPVQVQLGFIIDGSSSLSAAHFDLIKRGIANAIDDRTLLPRDGSVEICVVQIGLRPSEGLVREEIAPTVITDATVGAVVRRIRGIEKSDFSTATGEAILLCAELITGSPNFGAATRQVINIATDGLPTQGTDVVVASARARAAGIDELDVEALGNLSQQEGQLEQFSAVVFPQPVAWVPPDPMNSGFLRIVRDMNDFEEAIREKLPIVLPTAVPTLPPSPTPTRLPSPMPNRTYMPTATPVPNSTSTPTQTPTALPNPAPEIPEGNSLLLLASGLAALATTLALVQARRRRDNDRPDIQI